MKMKSCSQKIKDKSSLNYDENIQRATLCIEAQLRIIELFDTESK